MGNMAKNYYDQALGSFEAASLMGLHFGQPQKLAAKGVLTARMVMTSAYSDDPTRFVSIYDGDECEKNYQDYEEKCAARGGKTERRPRAWLHMRPEAVRRIKAIKTPIAFDDAITLAEAAVIIGVHPSLIARLIGQGKLVGRVPWNPRGIKTGARNWIISRRSCLEHARANKAAEAGGTKRGRPRSRKMK